MIGDKTSLKMPEG